LRIIDVHDVSDPKEIAFSDAPGDAWRVEIAEAARMSPTDRAGF